MSKRSRNFFAKLTHFFQRYFGSSRSTPGSLNDDIPSAALSLPPRLSTPSPSHQPAPSNKPLPPIPSLAIPPPQPPTQSTSQLPALPAAIPPSPPHSLQLLPHPMNSGTVPSHATASSSFLGYDAPAQPPPNLSLRPPAPGLTPPSSLPASRAPAPQPHEPTCFEGAHDFTFHHNPQFINNSVGEPGIDKLLKHSMPDAFYNSAARYPPPRCHLGTRNDYITKITTWALENSDRHEPILWMRGPFGVGKSAVAQSCAEALQPQNKLAATLFFSRSNTDRNDPRRTFTSIAYQIATICPLFRDIVNARIHNDPALAMKSLSTQFEELLIHPLCQIDTVKSGIRGRVVIIDGLDECRGTPEQCAIIDIIAASARDRTTPFRWFITSRPEDPIIRTMNSEDVSPVSFHLELPVSRETDHEILVYLVDKFEKIRKRHQLPASWPSEEVLALLVDRTAGLWIYITTIVRFITDENGFGPQDQLRIVLNFLKDVAAKVGVDNPLMEMDFFYTLIMKLIPLKIRTIVRKILLVYSTSSDWSPGRVASALDLSEEQFRCSCASTQSVMELRGSQFGFMVFHFYHASFLDFMKDPKRSKELFIYGSLLNNCRRECLDWVHQVCSRSTDSSYIAFPSEPILIRGWNHDEYYHWKLYCFWCLYCVPNHPIDLETAASLEKLQFRMMLQLIRVSDSSIPHHGLKHFRDNLPTGLRDKIIRNGKCPIPGCTNTKDVWTLGHGRRETIALSDLIGGLDLRNNQAPRPGLCFCGSQINAKR